MPTAFFMPAAPVKHFVLLGLVIPEITWYKTSEHQAQAREGGQDVRLLGGGWESTVSERGGPEGRGRMPNPGGQINLDRLK